MPSSMMRKWHSASRRIYLKDEASSILVDDVAYFVKRPFLKRLFESMVRLLSPLL